MGLVLLMSWHLAALTKIPDVTGLGLTIFADLVGSVTNLLQDPILLGFSFGEGNLLRMLRFGAAKGCTTIDLSQQ